jgi:Do/DeqQ family serine protease
MFQNSKHRKALTVLLAVAAVAVIFTSGFALSRLAFPDVVYRGNNATLNATAIDTLAAAPAVTAVAATGASDRAILQAFQNASRAVADSTLPVVVRIDVEKSVRLGNPFAGSPFQFFFNGQPYGGNQDNGPGKDQQDQDNGPTQKENGFGSGIIIEQKGDTVYVLTNNHVVSGADKYVIRTWDNKSFEGKLVGADKNRDLAVISFASKDKLPLARLGDSAQVRAGDIVYAVGSPYGIQNTVTQGIISATGRTGNDLPSGGGDTASNFTDYLQTDAAINPGNSGGALVNINGEVIGINTWIATRTGENVGLGFAVPVNNAKKVATDFITKGKVEYGWLGIQTSNIIDEARESLKLSKDQAGAFAASVIKGSPAEKSGLLPGDVITRINSVDIKSADDLIRNISGLDVNTEVNVNLIRNGSPMSLKVKLGLRAENTDELSHWPGFNVIPMSDQIRKAMQQMNNQPGSRSGSKATKQVEIPNGALLVIRVSENSNAAEAGLKDYDVLTAVSGQPIKSVAEFYQILGKNPGKDIQLSIQRNGKDITLSFQR